MKRKIMETKLKFKVGDKVRVKSLEWYNENKDAEGNIHKDENYGVYFAEGMTNWCGKIVQIKKINSDFLLVDDSLLYWKDWMFEDEVVAEEKQEQVNKNDMKTKEMTKEEVFAYLNKTKIMCTSDEETKKVQEKLFELGIEWKMTGKKINEEMYLLHIHYNYLLLNSDMRNWMNSKDKRIEPNEILTITLKEEKPKFDPKTLQPFDKVLVRDKECDRWRGNLFCLIKEELGYSYFCIYDNWKYCIPYNEDTKHLAGTNEEAPEFYRI